MMLYLATVAVLMASAFALPSPTEFPGNAAGDPGDILATSVSSFCPQGWVEYDVERVCLKAIDDRKGSWGDARVHCQVLGGDLVTVVKYKQQKDFVMGLMAKNKFYWIGIWDAHQIGNFGYIDGYAMGPWNAFMKGEPNNLNNNEHCVEMKNGKWYDKRCTRQRNYVCQKEFEDAL